MKRKKPTIYDVAEAAGVSITAVSDVLNGHDRISPETADMIRAVIADLGYVPRANRKRNQNRSGNHRKRTVEQSKTIGQVALMIPDPDPAAANTYQMERISRGLVQGLGEFNLEMITVSSNLEGSLPYCLRNNQVQGVVLRVGKLSGEQCDALRHLPCVQFFGITELDAPGDQVVVDNETIGRMAVQYLCEQGCDEFVVLSPDQKHPSFHLCAQSFDFGARLEGIKNEIIEIEEGGEMRDVFPSAPEPGRRLGIFIAGYNRENEPVVVENWLRAAGLTEENGVFVVGASSGTELEHAVIHIAPERIARHCAEQLSWRMQHPNADRRRIMIEPKLMEKRGSSEFGVPSSELTTTTTTKITT